MHHPTPELEQAFMHDELRPIDKTSYDCGYSEGYKAGKEFAIENSQLYAKGCKDGYKMAYDSIKDWINHMKTMMDALGSVLGDDHE